MAENVAGVPLEKTAGQTVKNGTTAKAAAAAEGNPAFRMMGLPNIKAKLPSRNWLIFLSITSSFAAAVYYDKRETSRLQQKYCDLVSPLAAKTISPTTMPRKMTIYLQAPPADGLRSAREHFYEYVKPILVAGAMDWDVVEGRREGDIRFGAAEKIRKLRRKQEGVRPTEETEAKDEIIAEQRNRVGCVDEEGVKGDLVIGRHAWKEYLRGLHEGWLGPLREAIVIDQEKETHQNIDGAPLSGDASSSLTASSTSPSPSPTASSTTTDSATLLTDTPPPEEKKPSLYKPAPYISPPSYPSATLPSSTPPALGPAIPLPLPHLLGFWNFPIRIHRFLTRRYVAEEVFSRTAAAVLAHHREWQHNDAEYAAHEEKEWHKSVRKPKVDDDAEKIEKLWLDPVVVDYRIVERLRVFELSAGVRDE